MKILFGDLKVISKLTDKRGDYGFKLFYYEGVEDLGSADPAEEDAELKFTF